MLKKELETLGEALSSERLERQAEFDRLKLENRALRQVLGERFPELAERFPETYERMLHEVDPEKEERAS